MRGISIVYRHVTFPISLTACPSPVSSNPNFLASAYRYFISSLLLREVTQREQKQELELPLRKRRDRVVPGSGKTRARTGVAAKNEKRWGCPQ
jgi:hypothetical protein